MTHASGVRSTVVTASTTLLLGLVLTAYGVIRGQQAHCLAGVVIAMVALTGIILLAVHHWIRDTSTERTALAAAQRETQAERARYIAAQAALTNEQGRLQRDLATERAADAERRKQERAALEAEFEERRASLIEETMEITILMIRDGKLAPDTSRSGATLIRFPPQQAARSREHGEVAP